MTAALVENALGKPERTTPQEPAPFMLDNDGNQAFATVLWYGPVGFGFCRNGRKEEFLCMMLYAPKAQGASAIDTTRVDGPVPTLPPTAAKEDGANRVPATAPVQTAKPVPEADADWRTDYSAFVNRLNAVVKAKAPAAAPKTTGLVDSLTTVRDGKLKLVLYQDIEMRAVFDALQKEFGGERVAWRGTVENVSEADEGMTVEVHPLGKVQSGGGWKYPETLSVGFKKGRYSKAQLQGKLVDVTGVIPDKVVVTRENLFTGIILWYDVGVAPAEKGVWIQLEDRAIQLVADAGTPQVKPTTTPAVDKPDAAKPAPQPSVVLLDQPRKLHTLEGHTDTVYVASFSPDGRWVVTGSRDETARLWDAETGKPLYTLTGRGSGVEAASFSPDGRRVLTASGPATVRRPATASLWDAKTGKLLRSLAGHKGEIDVASFSPDGRWVLTGSHDETARLWDAETGKLLRKLEGHAGWVNVASFSPDGRRVVTGSMDKTARLWDAETGKSLHTLEGHGNTLLAASFSPDGRRVITGSHDETARLWDAETGKLLHTLEGHKTGFANLVGLGGSVTDASFSPDGRRVLTGSFDKTARLWDAETGKPLRTLKGHEGAVAASFSPDGRWVLTGSMDKTARLWDAETGQLLRTLEAQAGSVFAASFSPDGRRVMLSIRRVDDDPAKGRHTGQIWQVAE